jgi:N-acetyltransferase
VISPDWVAGNAPRRRQREGRAGNREPATDYRDLATLEFGRRRRYAGWMGRSPGEGDRIPRVPGRALLEDGLVALEPLTLEHVDPLWAAARTERDTYAFASVPASREAMRARVDGQLADEACGLSLPFAIRDLRNGVVVGGTCYLAFERWPWPVGNPHRRDDGLPDAVEIGSTWLNPSAQRTAINTHAKFLLLGRAFDEWKVRRVTLKTDERNVRSRRAIERLGGKLDGLLRAHMPAADGSVRNTALYSILASEWPEVRTSLAKRL